MADWMDFLGDLGGAARGVTEGLTLGMKPFAAWEDVRTKDLANDKSDIALRDLLMTQNAREGLGVPDFYGNLIGSQDVGHRLTMAKGEGDIFGQERNLAFQRYLSDPNDAFQQGIAAMGVKPGDPEYNKWYAEAQGIFDPTAAVAGYEKLGIPALEGRQLNQEAVTQIATALLRTKDPGAQAFIGTDGRLMGVGSDGEPFPMPAIDYMKFAEMLQPGKTALGVTNTGITQQMAIAEANRKMAESGPLKNPETLKLVNGELTRITNQIKLDQAALTKLTAQPILDDDARAQAVALQQRINAGIQEAQQWGGIMRNMVGQTPVGSRAGVPPTGPRPTGGAAVTTRPGNPQQTAAMAAGRPPTPPPVAAPLDVYGAGSGWGGVPPAAPPIAPVGGSALIAPPQAAPPTTSKFGSVWDAMGFGGQQANPPANARYGSILDALFGRTPAGPAPAPTSSLGDPYGTDNALQAYIMNLLGEGTA
jgi:hypothetical protein